MANYNIHFSPTGGTRKVADILASALGETWQEIHLCRENFSAGLFYQMLGAMERTGSKNAFDRWDKNKPILLICGEQDPVGNMGKGATAVVQAMKKAGLPVTFHLLPGSRHMVLGENKSGAAEKARNIIAQWLLQ